MYRILDTYECIMRPYNIAQVCGFARGEAECKTTNECNIWAHNARVWHPISDLLHLRNDVLIGYARLILPEVKICASTRTCLLAYRNVNYAPIYPTLIIIIIINSYSHQNKVYKT